MNSDPSYGGRRREAKTSNIDIVPLIDVIFLLLFFFVLMSIQMVVQQGMPVNLAQAQEGQSVQDETAPVISVRPNGTVFWQKNEVTVSELENQLQKWKQSSKEEQIQLNVDRKVQHGTVVDVTDAIRSVGIENVVFTVEPSS